MITKTGFLAVVPFSPANPFMMPATTGILGVYGGYEKASQLTNAEKDILRKKYDMPSDANLTLRNIGRGITAGTIGGAGAGALGYLAGDTLFDGDPRLTFLASALPALTVGAYSAHKATQKYSKDAITK